MTTEENQETSRTEQLTITFPRGKQKLKAELLQRKQEDHLNVSAFMVSLLEKEFGYEAHFN